VLGIAGLTFGMGLDEGLGDIEGFGADHSRGAFEEVFDLVRIEAAPEEIGQSYASATPGS
jgi:hypothetical protein